MSKPSTNIVQFELELSKFIQKLLPEQVVIFHQKVHNLILKSVTLKNPVDTGFSRQNWQSGLSPNDDVVGNYGPAYGFPEVPPNLDDLKAYAVTYLWNNTPYIVYLEEGHSEQAPEGFVELALEEAKTMFGAG